MAKPKLENVLAGIPLFEGLSKRHLKKIASLAEVARYMEGASIVKEGQPGDSFFVALTGQAKVTVKGRTVHRVLPGDHFGEISLLDGGERTAIGRHRDPHDAVDDRSQGVLEVARGRSGGLDLVAREPGADDPPRRPLARPVAFPAMKAEFYEPAPPPPADQPEAKTEPSVLVGTAVWADGAVSVEADQPELRTALERAFRPTPVITDDAAYRRFGMHGEVQIQPGDLEWFRACRAGPRARGGRAWSRAWCPV